MPLVNAPLLPLQMPIATDISLPSVIVHQIVDSDWKDHVDLDLTLNNWQSWNKRVMLVLQLSSGLHLYLSGKVPEPDAEVEPRAHENWGINVVAVHAFILS